MSDPIKKEDDDVLTSIRRLVSAGSEAGDAAEVSANVKPTILSGKLVLSESHRVSTGPGDDPWTDTLERRIADLEAAVTAQKGDFEPDGSELLDRETPRTIDHLAAAKRMVAQIRETPSDTVDHKPAPATDHCAPEPLQLTPALAPNVAPASNTDDAPSESSKPAPNGPDQTPTSTEEAVAGTEVHIEPEAVAKTAPESASSTTAEAVPAPVGADEDVGDAAIPPKPNDPEIDEDALRLLISEVLREEFQGDLGERVTRSIRKLVRQEIKRALATHDLD